MHTLRAFVIYIRYLIHYWYTCIRYVHSLNVCVTCIRYIHSLHYTLRVYMHTLRAFVIYIRYIIHYVYTCIRYVHSLNVYVTCIRHMHPSHIHHQVNCYRNGYRPVYRRESDTEWRPIERVPTTVRGKPGNRYMVAM